MLALFFLFIPWYPKLNYWKKIHKVILNRSLRWVMMPLEQDVPEISNPPAQASPYLGTTRLLSITLHIYVCMYVCMGLCMYVCTQIGAKTCYWIVSVRKDWEIAKSMRGAVFSLCGSTCLSSGSPPRNQTWDPTRGQSSRRILRGTTEGCKTSGGGVLLAAHLQVFVGGFAKSIFVSCGADVRSAASAISDQLSFLFCCSLSIGLLSDLENVLTLVVCCCCRCCTREFFWLHTLLLAFFVVYSSLELWGEEERPREPAVRGGRICGENGMVLGSCSPRQRISRVRFRSLY